MQYQTKITCEFPEGIVISWVIPWYWPLHGFCFSYMHFCVIYYQFYVLWNLCG